MKPSQLKKGAKLAIKTASGVKIAFFIDRIPDEAMNLLRFPAYAGLNGPDDNGTCEMSDYELSRRANYA